MPHWSETFKPFSLMHALTLVWTVGLIVASCWIGVRWLRAGDLVRERTLAGAWGGFVIGVNLWSLVYWHLPAKFDAKESLPLQLCDLACLMTPLVFLTSWRWARSIVYFWGIGLSTQAFFTPTIRVGPADMEYWLFWLVHLAIVGSGVYDLFVRRYKPTLRDLGFVIACSLAWLAVAVLVNSQLGSNYGYVGNTTPENPTIVDKLGAWPLRAVLLVSIAIGLLCVLYAVWPLGVWVRAKLARRGNL